MAKTQHFRRPHTEQTQIPQSINVFEAEAILLAFELWAESWARQRVIIYTNSSTTESGLLNNTLIGQPNAPLRELLLLASKYDIVIEARWVYFGYLQGLWRTTADNTTLTRSPYFLDVSKLAYFTIIK